MVRGMPTYEGISYTPNKPNRLLMYIPAAGRQQAAKNCTKNFNLAERLTMSSNIPTTYIIRKPNNKYRYHKCTDVAAVYLIEKINNTKPNDNNIQGRNAIPPNLGMACLCLFRKSGMSYRLRSLQNFNINGMVIKPNTKLNKNDVSILISNIDSYFL